MSNCHKVCYTTRKEAKKPMKDINHNNRLDKKLTNAYYCSDCLHWHLTSKSKQSSRDYTRRLNKSK